MDLTNCFVIMLTMTQDPPNCGRPPRDLVAAPELTAMPRFAQLKLDHLDDDWWHLAEDERRLDVCSAVITAATM